MLGGRMNSMSAGLGLPRRLTQPDIRGSGLARESAPPHSRHPSGAASIYKRAFLAREAETVVHQPARDASARAVSSILLPGATTRPRSSSPSVPHQHQPVSSGCCDKLVLAG